MAQKDGNIGMSVKLAVLGAVFTAVAPLVKPIADKIADKIPTQNNKASEKTLVSIPTITNRNFPVTIEQATKMLEARNLKIFPITLTEANPRYKDCIELQVVDSTPSQRTKVEAGSPVIVKYITKDILEESKRLYEKQQETRAIKKAQRQAMIAEKKAAVQTFSKGATKKIKTVLAHSKEEKTEE